MSAVSRARRGAAGCIHDQPHSKWTLTRVSVNEFYGYAKVVETQRDVSRGEAAYRRNTSEYLNRAYATKGLLARTVMEDAAGRAFTESRNQTTR